MNPMRGAVEEARDALHIAIHWACWETAMTSKEILRCELAIESLDKCLLQDDEMLKEKKK